MADIVFGRKFLEIKAVSNDAFMETLLAVLKWLEQFADIKCMMCGRSLRLGFHLCKMDFNLILSQLCPPD